MATQLDKLLAAQERATQKKHEAEQQEKRIRKQISDLKNKERTHRLCTRGGYLEKLLLEPEAFTDDEVFELLGYAFNTPFVKDRLKATLGSQTPDPRRRKAEFPGKRNTDGDYMRITEHIFVRCAIIRTVPVRIALSEGPCGELDGLRPSSGASPCADSIGYPFSARGAKKSEVMKIPCPHFDIQIISRGRGRSVIAAAAYQSGETLFSQYTGTWESGDHEERIVHKEILLPPNAPQEYADRQTLWNAVDAAEDSPSAQTARRLIIALPKELTLEQNTELIRQYCQTTFVDKGMIADIAIHFNHEDPPNPHAHILLTMRAMDEHGKWLAKSKSVYALDEKGNRVNGKNGKPKRIKVDTVDWNNRDKCEHWRHEWEEQQNLALEAAGRPERINMRSYERQGIEMVPQKHLGPAAFALEKQGIHTSLGDHNKAVRMINSLLIAVKRKLRELSEWLKGTAEIIADHEKITSPYWSCCQSNRIHSSDSPKNFRCQMNTATDSQSHQSL